MMMRSQLLISLVMITLMLRTVPVNCAPLGKNVFASSKNVDSSEFSDKAYAKELQKVSWIGNEPVPALQKYNNPPDQDNARKEVDNFPSNIYSKYDNVQKKVKDWFDTEPLLDHIHESDKYGNQGDQFYFITKPLVQLTQKVAILTNKVFAAPRDLFRKANRNVSEKLNNFGGSLVGLRK
ncbi:uncharacterized protein LOC131694200 [Topomyia yanbarensis]|uniref:uncharacterized protein LOC131694200 n=1 Tax=Topomyia yanbarensis TaxID=2498891 RepID=UPI00273B693E|nr:uncharacterized protein LOC131694200 [Topomyia yanbarensis]